jgi:hypothetical protein
MQRIVKTRPAGAGCSFVREHRELARRSSERPQSLQRISSALSGLLVGVREEYFCVICLSNYAVDSSSFALTNCGHRCAVSSRGIHPYLI